jgi:hypothetical protein
MQAGRVNPLVALLAVVGVVVLLAVVFVAYLLLANGPYR